MQQAIKCAQLIEGFICFPPGSSERIHEIVRLLWLYSGSKVEKCSCNDIYSLEANCYNLCTACIQKVSHNVLRDTFQEMNLQPSSDEIREAFTKDSIRSLCGKPMGIEIRILKSCVLIQPDSYDAHAGNKMMLRIAAGLFLMCEAKKRAANKFLSLKLNSYFLGEEPTCNEQFTN